MEGPPQPEELKELRPVELLALDIDLRMTDLWREMADIPEWNLDAVAAFMRAAYGLGYCDALTEENSGQLCTDNGFKVPEKRLSPADQQTEF
ncbi:MAG TPA: hypothetical protein VLF88_03165 [Candidatus Babeliales bacterium]|nr:hypothetical protein [Candidatus Babeliales bacterium]